MNAKIIPLGIKVQQMLGDKDITSRKLKHRLAVYYNHLNSDNFTQALKQQSKDLTTEELLTKIENCIMFDWEIK